MTDPYPDDAAYLRDELARLDCRLRREVERFEGPIDQFGALYVSEEEVRAILEDRERAVGAEPEEAGLAGEELAARIRDRRAATREAGRTLRFDVLVDRMGLSELDRELLLLALAPELEGRYATVYAYLQDDARRTLPTVDFLVGLLSGEADRLALRGRFSGDAPLVARDLVQLEGSGPRTRLTVRPDERIVRYVLGESGLDARLSGVATLLEGTGGAGSGGQRGEQPALPPRVADLLASGVPASEPPPVVSLYGPEGVGKRAAVRSAVGPGGEPLLSAEARHLDDPALVDRLRREARLLDATVHVAGLADADPPTARQVLGRLDALDGPLFLTDAPDPPEVLRDAVADHVVLPVELPRPSYARRRAHWRQVPDLPSDLDPDAVAGTFRMTPGEIDDALARARAEARLAGEELAAEHVYAACRAQSGDELEGLARRIEPTFDWGDIVLPDRIERRLRELAARLAQQGTVYDEWGFESVESRGTGVVGLFTGPSGTGKTMAAEVVAGHAGLDLYRVDLSTVVSKYVGETESNIGRVFDAAADADAALLFDEADALFGERSEVSDAHDRYANIEVDYLLQRIEEHDGAVLLTSNLESNIDDAFLRRIHVSIEFPSPDRAARREIWAGAVPPAAPTGELDFDFLARFDLRGGNVRNVALGAAFLAAGDDEPLGMAHLVRALERELEKTGRVVDPDRFGEYRQHLE